VSAAVHLLPARQMQSLGATVSDRRLCWDGLSDDRGQLPDACPVSLCGTGIELEQNGRGRGPKQGPFDQDTCLVATVRGATGGQAAWVCGFSGRLPAFVIAVDADLGDNGTWLIMKTDR